MCTDYTVCMQVPGTYIPTDYRIQSTISLYTHSMVWMTVCRKQTMINLIGWNDCQAGEGVMAHNSLQVAWGRELWFIMSYDSMG